MFRSRRTRTPAVVAGAVAAVLAASPALAAPLEAPAATGNTWSADLAGIDSDDVNVRWTGTELRLADPAHRPAARRGIAAEGTLVVAPHSLAAPANRVRADVVTGPALDGAVEVAARGWRSGA